MNAEPVLIDDSVLKEQEYKFPYNYGLLSHNSSHLYTLLVERIKKGWTDPVNLKGISIAAKNVGFKKVSKEIKTRKGEWKIFDRRNFDMPNFPDGSTSIDSMLALYEGKDISQAVLRMSEKAFDDDQFHDNLEQLAKHYIERPLIFGFPSKAITNPNVIPIGMFAGGIIGAIIGYQLTENPAFLNNMNVPINVVKNTVIGFACGMIGSLLSYTALNLSSQKYAKSGLPLNEICIGNDVQRILSDDKKYLSDVSIKRELYQKLLEMDIVKTPEEFIVNVYPKIKSWSELIQKRIDEKEMTEKDFLAEYGTKKDALEIMVEASRLIQRIKPVNYIIPV